MELILQISDRAALATALKQQVGGVAITLPRQPASDFWAELKDWQGAARQGGLKFYLTLDWLAREDDLPQVEEMLAAAAGLDPDGLQLRDLGLVRSARRLYPSLSLQAAGAFGVHNSPGLRLAAALGFTRVGVEGPISLKDLALMRRQVPMPLTVTLAPSFRCYASLCLMEEYLGAGCEACCLSLPEVTPEALMASLETFSGLCQLGVEAVQIKAGSFPAASLARVIGLYQAVQEAAPMERPGVLAAARQVLAAFAEQLRMPPPAPKAAPGPPVYPLPLSQRSALPSSRSEFFGPGRIWLEARDYTEAVALAPEWREPLVLALTPDTYAAFLQQHRQWGARRLIWRLPPALPESALAFYQKALETLQQGEYNRFLAGDWGAAALAAGAGCQVYGDQTLGVRNSWAVRAARDLKVNRVCLPPGHRPEHWQAVLDAAPSGSFWSYLYHCATLAVCPPDAAALTPPETLRWFSENGKALLCLKAPQHLRDLDAWFKSRTISPLVVALPHSPRPRGQIPAWLAPRPPGRR
ncbi:MAG: U32 family peptidase [Syntrophobacterales bacterium]|jgi:collagenase-like PrtC family protease|nr:U32 family peptidase [Syntrophobacterales bacterium]